MTTNELKKPQEPQINHIKLGHPPSMDIEVTLEVINEGVRKNSSHCVVAEAVRKHLKMLEAKSNGKSKFSNVSVDLQTIRFSNLAKKERYTYLSPRSCQVCLVDFDQGKKPEPFKFRLRDGQTTRSGHSLAELAKQRLRKAKFNLNEIEREKQDVDELKTSNKATMRIPARGNRHGTIPEKVGGRTPPISIGNRRSFGLRALDR